MMATKRKPVLPSDLGLDEMLAVPGAARPQPAFHEVPPAAPPAVPAATADLKARAINMSIYLLPGDHRRLRQVAAAEDASIQSLVLDGIDRVFQERGMPPVERWQPRRKPR